MESLGHSPNQTGERPSCIRVGSSSFAELDWSSSANDRAESVLGPARPFAELDWSSSANSRAESVLGPTRRTAELNPRLFQLGERPS
ncbi:LOW QUALITY PROTEIN: hypothetical protein HID58_066939 [Brassica napus]|uniref:Uncharacterized protein n=1 Tax=Brassica napus TaxID=3708 RepID=A0ABQ7ZH39_BRANA|nr:LOW QUALITY PROTEIN: hypothetical protein HID58_066939 [Brassica napus]